MQEPKDGHQAANDTDAGGADRKDDDYRDDRKDFGESSDYATGKPVGRYTGNSPGTTSEIVREKGSQDWQQGIVSEQAASADDAAAPSDDGVVKSRSADPGQSSYGGFKGEGAVPKEILDEQAAALRDEQKPRSPDDMD